MTQEPISQPHSVRADGHSEEIFRLLVESVSDYAIFALDPTGRIATWNKGAERLKGYRASEIIGKHFSCFYLPEDAARGEPQHGLEHALKDGRHEGSGWRIRKDGSRFWANVIITPLTDETGTVLGFAKVTRDMTERKQAEDDLRAMAGRLEIKVQERTLELEASASKYRALTESLPLMMWTATPDGSVNHANTQCLVYTGMSNQEKFGEGWTTMIHPDDSDAVYQSWRNSMDTHTPFTQEYRIRGVDGRHRWFLGRAVAIKNAEGKVRYWIGTATDIEAQKQAIESLQTERDLREQFVSTLTHDLRNPLSAAKTTAQVLGRYTLPPEKQTLLTGRIVGSLNRANQMIENLLDANRIKAGESLQLETHELDVLPLTRETLADLTAVYGRRFVLDVTDPSIVGIWNGDALRRMIENLCTNAVKYGSTQDPITVKIESSIEHMSIQVHNSGNPISPENQMTFFEPFQRASGTDHGARAKGWGLGLTLIRGLAEAHGGSVGVRSSLDEGTTFTVTLPKKMVGSTGIHSGPT